MNKHLLRDRAAFFQWITDEVLPGEPIPCTLPEAFPCLLLVHRGKVHGPTTPWQGPTFEFVYLSDFDTES